MTEPRIVNGVNLEQLMRTIDAIKANPNLARMTLRAETEWNNGHYAKTKIQNFSGLGAEATPENQDFLGKGEIAPMSLIGDNTSNALASTLATLSSCITTDFVFHAALQGIQLDSLQLRLEANIDLRGFFGLANKIRPGYQSLQLSYHLKSGAPRDELENLCASVQKLSPILDLIRNPVPVTVEMETQDVKT